MLRTLRKGKFIFDTYQTFLLVSSGTPQSSFCSPWEGRGLTSKEASNSKTGWTKQGQSYPALLSSIGIKRALWEEKPGRLTGRTHSCISALDSIAVVNISKSLIIFFLTKCPAHSFCTVPGKLCSQSRVRSGFVCRRSPVSLAAPQKLPSTTMPCGPHRVSVPKNNREGQFSSKTSWVLQEQDPLQTT